MNYIERTFYALASEISKKDEDAIYYHMLAKFNCVHPQTKESIERFFSQYPYWGKLDLKNENYEFIKLRAKVLKNNLLDYIWLFEQLKDNRSKKVLYAIINNYYNLDFKNLKECTETNFRHYFDLDLMPKMEGEVFVDVGSYVGDTVLEFVNAYGREGYKKIYCYDITPTYMDITKGYLEGLSDIIFRNKAVLDKSGNTYLEQNKNSASANKTSPIGTEKIEATSLDEDIEESISIIKMDIEGDEQKAIKGAKEHISRDNPKMLISVYHSNEDLFEIPKLIYKINKKYDFYLRYYGGCIFPTETVLICLPKNNKK